jgi:hypothetical protein
MVLLVEFSPLAPTEESPQLVVSVLAPVTSTVPVHALISLFRVRFAAPEISTVPDPARALLNERELGRDSLAPEEMETDPDPRAFELPRISVPFVMEVPPEYVLALFMVRVPELLMDREPVPAMEPLPSKT